MKQAVTAAQMKSFDADTIENIGICSGVLMERAALGIAEEVLAQLALSGKSGKVLCVCGTGNNGGDGAACARILFMKGIRTEIFYAGDLRKRTEDNSIQAAIAERLGIPCTEDSDFSDFDIIVDALFGIGLTRNIEGDYAAVIHQINTSGAYVISADIPSGIHSDTGAVMGTAIRADTTVAIQLPKPGHFLYPGAAYAGKITVCDIGICTKETDRTIHILEENDLKRILPVRAPDGNKGTFGKVLIIAGSKNMSGASYISSLAAMRCGAGMVKLITPEENREIMQRELPEALLSTWSCAEEAMQEIDEGLKWADAAAAGPGMGRNPEVGQIVRHLLEAAQLPLVLDADALNCLSGDTEILKEYRGSLTITPHIVEMSRLIGLPPAEIKKDPLRMAREFSLAYGINTVLKDARTCISDRYGNVYINITGNNGMATAGSGDALTGILASFLAMGVREDLAGAAAALVHGMAGDLAAEETGPSFLIATDLVQKLSKVFRRCGR